MTDPQPVPMVVTKVEKIKPDEALLIPCDPPPKLSLLINDNLVASRNNWRKAFKLCNEKHQVLLDRLKAL